jgi:Tfp pilus assembly protein PilF
VRAALERGPGRRGAIAAGVVVVVGALVLAPKALDGWRHGFIERGSFWRAAITIFRAHPVLGSGLDTFGQHFLRVRPASHAHQFQFTQAESAHSVPLNMLANGGIVLAATYVALVVVVGWTIVRGLRRLEGRQRLLLGGLAGAWVGYQVQSIVSIDVPPLALAHLFLAAAIVVVALEPDFRLVTLPGEGVTVRGSGAHRQEVVSASTWVASTVVAVAVLVGMWLALRPFRADLASAAVFRGTPAQGKAHADSAVALAPWQGRYWVERTQVYERLGHPVEAVQSAKEAARREPGSSQYALLAGRLEARYTDAKGAGVEFDEALRRDPNDPAVWLPVAQWAVDQRPALAARLSSQLVRLQPDVADNWSLRARALLATGDRVGAKAAVRRFVALDPTHLATWRLAATIDHDAGDLQAARRDYEQALRISPDHPQVLVALARVEHELGDDASARAHVARAASLWPQDPDVVAAESDLVPQLR